MKISTTLAGTNYDHSARIQPALHSHNLGTAYGVSVDGNTYHKPVLEQLGYRLQPLQSGNYLVTWLAPEIVVKDHYWILTETGVAGNAIDFLMRIRRTSFSVAVRLLRADVALPKVS